ncbi:hypothetical protein NMG60_11011747 [Bertholletia excelsa]
MDREDQMVGVGPFLVMVLVMTACMFLMPRVSSSSSSSIYDVLGFHGLPMGLFPKGINNFSMDPSTGRFEFLLNEACNAKFETHVHFDWNVSGILSIGQIAKLTGISAQDLFLWFPVKGIRVDIPSSGLIYFDVGVLQKQFSLSFFETPLDCTAGNTSSPPLDLLSYNGDSGADQNDSGKLLVKQGQASEFRADA